MYTMRARTILTTYNKNTVGRRAGFCGCFYHALGSGAFSLYIGGAEGGRNGDAGVAKHPIMKKRRRFFAKKMKKI